MSYSFEENDSQGEINPGSFLVPQDATHPSANCHRIIIPRNLCDSSCMYNVFLRIKPTSVKRNHFKIIDLNTLEAIFPKESIAYKNNCKYGGSFKYKYSEIIDQDAQQIEVFEKCIAPLIGNFVEKGENCVVMTYGTTSAGKTFTMQGCVEHPGVIPRAFVSIFSKLECCIKRAQSYATKLQPYRGCQLLELSDQQFKDMMTHKNFILDINLAKFPKSANNTLPITLKAVDLLDPNEKIPELEESLSCSVWISMFEVYNENVIDLLVPLPVGLCTKKNLSVGIDERGEFFVKNLRQILVNSAEEAYKVCQYGSIHQQQASTALNERSSRSHVIVQLTVVRHGAFRTVNILTRFSFVDLAGSERAKKTNNQGDRLNESKSINKSLVTLGQCLNVLKDIQQGGVRSIVPFRDSNLTKLFKCALLGSERLTFIINISSDPNLFDETVNVLKFSALAQEIVPKQNVKYMPRYSRIFVAEQVEENEEDTEENRKEIIQKLKYRNEELEVEIDNLKKLLEDKDKIIRRELATKEYHEEHIRQNTERCNDLRTKAKTNWDKYVKYKDLYMDLCKKYKTLKNTSAFIQCDVAISEPKDTKEITVHEGNSNYSNSLESTSLSATSNRNATEIDITFLEQKCEESQKHVNELEKKLREERMEKEKNKLELIEHRKGWNIINQELSLNCQNIQKERDELSVKLSAMLTKLEEEQEDRIRIKEIFSEEINSLLKKLTTEKEEKDSMEKKYLEELATLQKQLSLEKINQANVQQERSIFENNQFEQIKTLEDKFSTELHNLQQNMSISIERTEHLKKEFGYERDILLKRIAESEVVIKELSQERDDLQKRFNEENEKLKKEFENERDFLLKQVTESEVIIKELSQERDDLHKRFKEENEKLKKEFKNEKDFLLQRVTESEVVIKELSQERDDLRRTVNEENVQLKKKFENERDYLLKQITESEIIIKELSQERDDLRRTVNEENEQLKKKFENERDFLLKQVTENEVIIKELSQERDDLRRTVNEENVQLKKKFENERDFLLKQVTENEVIIKELSQERDDLRRTVNEENEQLKKKFENERDFLLKQVTENEVIIKELSQERDDLRRLVKEENEKLKKEFKNEKDFLLQRVTEIEVVIKEISRERDDLQKKLKALLRQSSKQKIWQQFTDRQNFVVEDSLEDQAETINEKISGVFLSTNEGCSSIKQHLNERESLHEEVTQIMNELETMQIESSKGPKKHDKPYNELNESTRQVKENDVKLNIKIASSKTPSTKREKLEVPDNDEGNKENKEKSIRVTRKARTTVKDIKEKERDHPALTRSARACRRANRYEEKRPDVEDISQTKPIRKKLFDFNDLDM